MPNKRYVSGRRFEYQVRDWYRKRGYFVLRSAGSHTPIDLAVFYPNDPKKVVLIQCKQHGQITKTDKEILQALKQQLGVPIFIAHKSKHHKIHNCPFPFAMEPI